MSANMLVARAYRTASASTRLAARWHRICWDPKVFISAGNALMVATPYRPAHRSVWQSMLGLLVAFAICFAVAGIGAVFEPDAWYAQLVKPTWNPPNWVFPPIWTALYAMMAIAAWMVWHRAGLGGAPAALALFAVQLALNGAWSWLFFGLHLPGLALADIVLLWLALAATLLAFARVRRLAGILLLPYLVWVSFAGALNFALWRLNA